MNRLQAVTTVRWMVFAVALVASPAAASAQAKPNFSGEWGLDREKSDYGPQPVPMKLTQTIVHEDPKLAITLAIEGPNGEYKGELKYTTDGKESSNEVLNNTVKATAKWDGDTLVIDSKSNFNGNDITLNDRWTLSADGKTLAIKRHFQGPQGAADQTIVLEKKSK
jgi:hypothetical protein